jgi:hypothetical protein
MTSDGCCDGCKSAGFDFGRKKRKKFFIGFEYDYEGALATPLFEGATALITLPFASTLTDCPNLFAFRMTSSACSAVW